MNYCTIVEKRKVKEGELHKYAEMVRAAFKGISTDLFDNIQVINENSIYNDVQENDPIQVNINDADFAFILTKQKVHFLSKSKFTFRPKDKIWELQVGERYNEFGRGFLVEAKTPRECILGMINCRIKELEEDAKSLYRYKKEIKKSKFKRMAICYA